MPINLKGRCLLSLNDLYREELLQILEATRVLKQQFRMGNRERFLQGKTLGMIFQKPSTRTRVSFEVAMYQLGGTALYFGANELQLGRGETIPDTARVLSRYLDAILARVYQHQDILDLAQYATVPVINGLSDFTHPCQGLTDLFTIYERRSNLKGLRIAYVGDGNNVAHSLIFGVARVGAEIVLATPKGYEPNPEVIKSAEEETRQSGAKITVLNDPREAARDADVIYTDVWTSMGQEKEREQRLKVLQPYQVNADLVKQAKKDVIVMHCLPAHRGEEITDEVIDGPNSVVWDQAENRLHTQKALLVQLMR